MPTGDTRVSVGPLLNALQSESLRVRIYAVLALRMRQGPSRKARAALQEAQDHQDPDVQLLAKALLEKQGKQRRISELREVPNSPELKAKLSAEAMKAVCSVVSAANEKGLRPFQ